MSLPKLIDRANAHGYSIRQHQSGVYQVYLGRATPDSTPLYTSHDLDRCRTWRDGRAKSKSNATVPSSMRAERGQVQLGLRLTVADRARLLAGIDALRGDGETNADVIIRCVSRVCEAVEK
jgi:hypothetical protein